ncbi:hypothetical protein PIB30_080144 [Stylosanthes scabra]|uniref:Uncharacterized protein n=1 Tax=Stylosanthes scabra TaxID=79078 RepID=A0ABU6SS16_9FABA|nr:hypothetical protein [Stylosanthes scabra]
MADLDKLDEVAYHELSNEDLLVVIDYLTGYSCKLVENATNISLKFASSSSNLDKLLGYQRPISEKSGLGYSGESEANLKTMFVKAKASTSNTKSPAASTNIKNSAKGKYCSKCNKTGYTPPQCFVFERKIGNKT